LGGRDRLAVDAAGAGRPPPPLLEPDQLAQGVVDLLQGAVVTPFVEVAPDGGLGREVLGQVTPLAAGAQKVEDRVHHVTQGRLTRSAARVDRDQRLDQGPLLVAHIAGVLIGSHPGNLRNSPPYGTDSENGAKILYQKLGFRVRRTIQLTVVSPAG